MKISLLAVFFLISGITISPAQNKDAILGKWISEHGNGQIEIHKQGDKYFGKLVWLKEPTDAEGKPKTDIHNPSKELCSQPILGLEIFKNLVFKSDGIWENGTVYDPKSGRTYDCKISMISSDKLDIRGYKGVSFMGKTVRWNRVY